MEMALEMAMEMAMKMEFIWLVVEPPTPLKNMKVNGKDYPIYEMENKIPSEK
jgi:hypothetical protein